MPSQQKLCRYVYFYTRQTWICRLWRTRVDAATAQNNIRVSFMAAKRNVHVVATGDWRVKMIWNVAGGLRLVFVCIMRSSFSPSRRIGRWYVLNVRAKRKTLQLFTPQERVCCNHSCAVECEWWLHEYSVRTTSTVYTCRGTARRGMMFMIMLIYVFRYGGWRVRAYYTQIYEYTKHLNGHKKDVTHNWRVRCVSVSWCSWILIGKTCVESVRVACVFLFT